MDKDEVIQKASYIGDRLREKSTYSGLLTVVSLALVVAAKYDPNLVGIDPNGVVVDLSMIGMGVGGLLAIFLPEKKK